MAVKKVYFVRHGEAAGNAGGFSQIATTPLTEIGHKQASDVAERFRNISIEAVCASYYDQAQETARYIAAVKNTEVETLEYFHEIIKPTSVQGAAHSSEAYIKFHAAESENYFDLEWKYEDEENFSDVLERVANGVTFLESRPENSLVVVTHGRLLKFITIYLLLQKNITPEIERRSSMKATNTGISMFEFENSKWTMRTWNDIAHFAE